MDRMTPAEWTEYLTREHSPITITEYMAGCLSRLLGAQIEQVQALRHLEGMIGALDDTAARAIPDYPASAKVREALAAAREQSAHDSQQRLREAS